MKLINNGLIKFDRQFPVYNFFFPMQTKNVQDVNLDEVLKNINVGVSSRALYFHIPFCETICSFCPFTRVSVKDNEQIDLYVEALLSEMDIKAKLVDLRAVPVSAIFFGGGTPSLLSPEHILKIGTKIHELFDTSKLKEFSFEVEVKSINIEKVKALKEIGVTHPRFGLQTFNSRWREIFNLTSTIEQINDVVKMLNSNFKYVSFDLLYGMNGQDEQEIIEDLDKAIALNTSNIDVYPIDNIVTQTKLHRKYKELNLLPTSAIRKFNMNILVDKYMRSKGFMPHNGHGYFRCDGDDNEVVTNKYSFVYHEHVYGYFDYDLLGFGVNAVSSLRGVTITNTSNRNKYIDELMEKTNIPCQISKYDICLDQLRPIILRLPYHGVIDKKYVNLEFINDDIFIKIQELKKADMIKETDTSYYITKYGWYWYVDMMYYLMPKEDQKCLDAFVAAKLRESDRLLTKKEVITLL